MLKKASRLTDDLFEKSAMSFGEHLEELRKALVKAFLWLGVGAAIGMFFADRLVKYIEVPMRKSLKEFNIKKFKLQYAAANGKEPSQEFADFMGDQEVVPKLAFIEPDEIRLLLAEIAENKSSPAPAAASAETKSTEGSEQPPQGAVLPKSESGGKNNSVQMWKGVDADMLSRLRPIRLWQPMKLSLATLNALDGFMIWLKAGLVAGVVLASPGIFWHIWEFLAAGLYPHERRYVYLYLPLSIVLLLCGICLAFYVIFPLVLNFLLTYNLAMDIEFEPRLNDYMSFALFLPLGFGIAFQLPLVMLALNRFGIVSIEMFVSKWRIAVLAIAFASMVLTPADIYSMLGMFVPLTLLYFAGIGLCKIMPTGPGLGSQALDPQG